MVSPATHDSQGVLREVRIARDEGVRIVQIIGYRDGEYASLPDAGRLYAWNWENLKNLLK